MCSMSSERSLTMKRKEKKNEEAKISFLETFHGK